MNWRPVFTDSEIRENLMLRLQCIAEAIKDFPMDHPGLMGGDGGKALFFFYLYRLTDDEKHFEKGVAIIETISDRVQVLSARGGNFASGLTGFGWLLQHIENEKILDTGTQEFLSTLDVHNSVFLDNYLQRQNYDYLHGALGIGLYYLTRWESNADRVLQGHIENIILSLNRNSVWREKCCYWNSYDVTTQSLDPTKFNLGLAHGLPSIILFLVETLHHNILPDLCLTMIRGALQTIQQCQVDPEKYGCFFPNTIENGVPTLPSRLAWCYGDLGIAICLLKAGLALKEESFINTSMEIFRFQVTRKDHTKNLVWDAGFCHGTAGIAFMFHKAYHLKESPFLRDAALYWYGETNKMRKFPDGIDGYKTYRGAAIGTFECDAGLIEGLAGTGLCMMSSITDLPPKWASAFLLM